MAGIEVSDDLVFFSSSRFIHTAKPTWERAKAPGARALLAVRRQGSEHRWCTGEDPKILLLTADRRHLANGRV